MYYFLSDSVKIVKAPAITITKTHKLTNLNEDGEDEDLGGHFDISVVGMRSV